MTIIGIKLDSQDDILKEVTSFYKTLLTKPGSAIYSWDWVVLTFNNDWYKSFIQFPFIIKEFKEETFYMEGDKALGLDGFSILFFQHYWEIIKWHMCGFLFDFI